MNPGTQDLERDLGRFYADGAEAGCGMDQTLAARIEGRLNDSERRVLDEHLETCPACRQVLELARQVEPVWEQAGPEPAGGWSFGRLLAGPWWPRLTAVAAAALVLVVALVWTGPGVEPGSTDRLVPKGAWQLHVAAEVEGRTFRVVDGTRLPTGARLGFFYSAQQPGYLLVFYADEGSEIVRLVPAGKARAVPIQAGHQVRLPDGAVLSPGRGCEWVVALFSKTPLSDPEATEAVARILSARRGCRLSAEAVDLTGVQFQIVQVLR